MIELAIWAERLQVAVDWLQDEGHAYSLRWDWLDVYSAKAAEGVREILRGAFTGIEEPHGGYRWDNGKITIRLEGKPPPSPAISAYSVRAAFIPDREWWANPGGYCDCGSTIREGGAPWACVGCGAPMLHGHVVRAAVVANWLERGADTSHLLKDCNLEGVARWPAL